MEIETLKKRTGDTPVTTVVNKKLKEEEDELSSPLPPSPPPSSKHHHSEQTKPQRKRQRKEEFETDAIEKKRFIMDIAPPVASSLLRSAPSLRSDSVDSQQAALQQQIRKGVKRRLGAISKVPLKRRKVKVAPPSSHYPWIGPIASQKRALKNIALSRIKRKNQRADNTRAKHNKEKNQNEKMSEKQSQTIPTLYERQEFVKLIPELNLRHLSKYSICVLYHFLPEFLLIRSSSSIVLPSSFYSTTVQTKNFGVLKENYESGERGDEHQ
ncbi:unnamed protein product [Caenorhabditis brenneri]